jgi:glycosyltransferase involved in cell wall biosynthesis
MGKVFLSAAMIVRNEAGHLEACLRSIVGLVDEIVVVDTGSTDATPDIARCCGARLHDFTWRDDFAAARNEALGLARGEWVLYIDADERVRPASRDRLHNLLADRSLVGCCVRLHARTGYTPFREMRLFRNDPRIRFEGLIHENIWPGITRYMDEAGGVIGDSELVLDHVGYDGPQDRKHHRNLPLLLDALERDPDRVYCWYHLGLVYLGLGERARARDAWFRALAAVGPNPTRVWADSLAYVELIQLDFAEGTEVEALLDEALQRFPGHAHLIWLRGQALLREGRLKEAVPVFEALAAWRMGQHEADGALGYDERLFGVLAYEGLAACHFRLAQYREAERCFALAEEREPDRLEYRVKRQLCAQLARAVGGSPPGQMPVAPHRPSPAAGPPPRAAG